MLLELRMGGRLVNIAYCSRLCISCAWLQVYGWIIERLTIEILNQNMLVHMFSRVGDSKLRPCPAITMQAEHIIMSSDPTLQRARSENAHSAQRWTSHASVSKAGQRMLQCCRHALDDRLDQLQLHATCMSERCHWDVEHTHMPRDTSHLSCNLLARYRVQTPQRSHGGRRCWQERQRICSHAADPAQSDPTKLSLVLHPCSSTRPGYRATLRAARRATDVTLGARRLFQK